MPSGRGERHLSSHANSAEWCVVHSLVYCPSEVLEDLFQSSDDEESGKWGDGA
jgi:hypothetical protein